MKSIIRPESFSFASIIDGFEPFISEALDYKVHKKETDAEILIAVELPGASRDSIEVTTSGTTLNISAVTTILGKEYHVKKSITDRLYKLYFDTSNIIANYVDGVLTITIPKSDSAQPKQIKVN
jgi:HSP20 family molecular chaperone IbpA